MRGIPPGLSFVMVSVYGQEPIAAIEVCRLILTRGILVAKPVNPPSKAPVRMSTLPVLPRSEPQLLYSISDDGVDAMIVVL